MKVDKIPAEHNRTINIDKTANIIIHLN
ncbi:hypothetical protein LCGC14_2997030, partial [marine sediment metagenome]